MENLLRPYALDVDEAKETLDDNSACKKSSNYKKPVLLALSNDTFEVQGIILFIGNIIQLRIAYPEEFKELVDQEYHEDDEILGIIENLLDYQWAVVKTETAVEGIHNIVYNYAGDPSGVIALRQ